MGANTHQQLAFSAGYKVAASAAGVCYQIMPALAGYRASIQHMAYTCTSVSSYVNVLQVSGSAKIGTTNVASGASTVTMASSTLFASLAFSSGCFIAVELQNGTTQLCECTNSYASNISVTIQGTDILTASALAGANVWGYPKIDAAGNMKKRITAITQETLTAYGGAGYFFASGKGYPLPVVVQGTAAASIDYVVGGYINS